MGTLEILSKRKSSFRSSVENGTFRCLRPFPMTVSNRLSKSITSREQFIDSATSIENGAGDGVDWPLDERPGSIAEEQTKGTVVVDWQKSFL